MAALMADDAASQGGLLCKGVTPGRDRAIDSGEGGWAFRAGPRWKAREAFESVKEGRGSGCALRRRPPCLWRRG